MLQKIISAVVITAFFLCEINTYSQCTSNCTITAGANPTVTCPGEPVSLSAQTSCNQLLMNNNFNNGTVGTGWQSTNQAMFTNPCGAGLDGTTHLWMGSTSPAPRNVTTVPYDVSNGGTICFDMKYSVQAAASPCEGPDLPDEGVHLQYSVNSGPWVDIDYWDPNGGNDPYLTQWLNYCRQIPQAAWSTSTQFRWAQVSSSGNDYDHWGLDNVVISVPPPNATVQWSNGSSGYYPPTVNPTATTTYTATLTDNNGCTAATTVTITITDTIHETQPSISYCLGSSLTINAPTGTGFTWSNGAATQSITVTPTVNTAYKVTITGNACVKVETYPVTIKQSPTASFTFTPNPACVGQVVQFTSTSILLQTCTGFGCPGGPLCFCVDNPTLYSWTFYQGGLPESTSQDAPYTYATLGTQQVSLMLFDVLTQCTSSITIPVDVINCDSSCASPTPVLAANTPVCLGNSSTITVSNLASYSNGATFTWNFNGGTATPGTGGGPQDVIWNNTGTFTVTLTVTEPGCIAAQASITIDIIPAPTSTFTVTSPVCPGEASAIVFTGSASTTAIYNWDFSGGTIISGSDAGPYLVSWASSGSMNVTLAVDDNGCTSNSSQPVVVLSSTNPICDTCHTPTPVLTANSPVCLNQSAVVSATGGATTTFIWNFNGGTAIPGSGPGPHTVTWTTPGNKIISVVASNPNCMPDSASVTVIINPLPNANAGADQNICTGGSATLTASGGANYLWSTGASTQSISVSPSSVITYSVTVSDSFGCAAVDSVKVTISPLPLVDFSSDITGGCQPLPVNFTSLQNTNIQSYTWNFNDPSSGVSNTSTLQNPFHLFNNAGVYNISLTVTSSDGCSNNLTMSNMITVQPNPVANFSFSNAENNFENTPIQFTNQSVGAVSWQWNFGDPNAGNDNISSTPSPQHTFLLAGSYVVCLVVGSNNGCIDTSCKDVIIKHNIMFYAPSAFSPDGDGTNDIFSVKGIGFNNDEFQIYIFSRWGEVIFHSDDINFGWDGTVKSNKIIAPEGVYTWVVYVKDFNGERKKYFGTITLLK